jgi:hypothetical protein
MWKQWFLKWTGGPVKAPVNATWHMDFFDNKGRVYTNYAPRGKTVNANCLIKALHVFMKL